MQRFVRKALILATLLAALFAGRAATAADPPTVKSEVTALLAAGWDTSTDARAAATARIDAIATLGPTDLRALYAIALVQMKQRRYPEAQRFLDRILTLDKDHLPALRARAWVGAITRQFGRTLADIDRIVALLPPEHPDNEAERPIADTCRMVGRLVGFLEGPANDVSTATSATEARERLAGRLSESRKAAFYQGRQIVLDKFADFTVEREQKIDENIAAAKEDAERTKADIDRQREQNSAEAEKLESLLERLKSDSDRELSDIDAQAPPFQARMAAADRAGAIVQNRLIGLTNEINILRTRLAQEKDPIQRDRLQRDISRLDGFRARVEFELIPIQREYNLAAANLQQLLNRRAQVVAKYSSEYARTEKTLNALRKSDTRLGAIERRLDQPTSGVSPKTRALSAQATALTTYDTFPLEEERERVLGLFP